MSRVARTFPRSVLNYEVLARQRSEPVEEPVEREPGVAAYSHKDQINPPAYVDRFLRAAFCH
jgi:hypothetical protein